MCKQCLDKPKTFHVPQWSVSQVKNAIPARLFARHAATSLYYTARDVVMAAALAYAAWRLDALLETRRVAAAAVPAVYFSALRGLLWCSYWWFQGLTFTGLWVIAHECGHSAFSPYPVLNDAVGFVLHSFLGTPYYSWKYSHRQHHRYNGHLEKDEHWIPKSLDQPPASADHDHDHGHGNSGLWEFVEDTPLFQLAQLLVQQAFGFQGYLLFNISGQPTYPRWTSHFDPYSILFRPDQRLSIALSDLGILLSLLLLSSPVTSGLSAGALWRLYGIPWFLLNNWITMIVFLQHTDAAIPHYRKEAWTYARGALATVDRKFLGWMGEFFLHGVAHFHVVHHFFPKMPFYHLGEATAYAKEVLGRDYYECDTPIFRALWENHRHCQYVDAQGAIVFYKDKTGSALVRTPAEAKAEAEVNRAGAVDSDHSD
ncbi:hypothetical protein M0805_006785 [Coniferiporia weirii]|nr:hypothetical protein M0805_006785 [Coniferiporia weirii]